MRKGLFFWFSVFLAAAIIGGVAFFFGKTPERLLDVTKAIPAIDAESPHLFVVLEGGQIEPGLPGQFLKKADMEARSVLNVIDDLMPLFSFAKQSAAVVAWHENEAVFYGCFLLTKEMAADMNAGKIPENWLGQSSGLALTPSETEGLLDLSAGGEKVVFKVRMEGNLLMIAFSPEGIEKMSRAFSGEDKPIDAVFKTERPWPAHLRFYDGRLLAQAASARGAMAPDAPIGGEIAWNNKGENGEIAWELKGLQEWVPENIRSKLSPHDWTEEMYVPDPLIAAAGLAVPEGMNELASGDIDIPDWIAGSGLDRDSLSEILAGPVMLTAGGQSRIFLFSLPGVLLQLPDRGVEGIKWIDNLWGGNWAGFTLTPKTLAGFTAGGFLSIPLSLVAAARDDLAIAGVISASSLEKTLSVKEIVKVQDEKALFWLYADFPEIADALENIGKLGSLVDRFGVGSQTPEEVLAAANQLRLLGKVSVVLNDLESGRGGWTDATSPEE